MDGVLWMDRRVLGEWAKSEWPEPQIGLGYVKCRIPHGAAWGVMEALVQRLDTSCKLVSGESIGRRFGRVYPWGASVFEPWEKSRDVIVPGFLDCKATGCEAIQEVDGSFWTGGRFFRLLREMGCHFTRIDISIDFYGYEIDPVVRAKRRGDYVGFRASSMWDSSDQRGGGRLVYFGNPRGGGSFVAVYEKGAERGEAFPVLRFEYRALGDDAHALMESLCDAVDPRVVAAGTLTRVDFLKGAGGAAGNANRCKRYAWFQKLVDLAGRAVPYDRAASREKSFEGFLSWIKASWPRALVKLREALGEEETWSYINTLMQEGGACLPEDQAEIRRWRESRSKYFFRGAA